MSETELGKKILKYLEEKGPEYYWIIADGLGEPYPTVESTLEKLHEEKLLDKTPEINRCACSSGALPGTLYSLGTGKINEPKYFDVDPDTKTREELDASEFEKHNKSEKLDYFI